MLELRHPEMEHHVGLHWTTGGTLVFVCALLLSIMSSAAVALQFVARGYLLRALGPSDWFLLVNLVFSYGNTAWMGFHVAASLDQFHDKLHHDGKECYLVETYAVMAMSNVSLILTKISVLLLFLNFMVFGTLRRITFGVLVVVAVYGLTLTITNTVLCIPVHAFWQHVDNPDRKCIDYKAKWYADAGINIALDILIFCLPIPAVRSMTIPRKQKLWLYAVFTVGFIICVVSVIRLYYLYISPFATDSRYKGTNYALWSTLEMNLAIVVACAPTFKPLITRFCNGAVSAPNDDNIRGLKWANISVVPVSDNVSHVSRPSTVFLQDETKIERKGPDLKEDGRRSWRDDWSDHAAIGQEHKDLHLG